MSSTRTPKECTSIAPRRSATENLRSSVSGNAVVYQEMARSRSATYIPTWPNTASPSILVVLPERGHAVDHPGPHILAEVEDLRAEPGPGGQGAAVRVPGRGEPCPGVGHAAGQHVVALVPRPGQHAQVVPDIRQLGA